MQRVEDIEIKEEDKVKDIIVKMGKSGGFQAKNLWIAFEILKEMIKDKECFKILSFPACIIATGCRGIIKEMVRRKWFNLVITTCGTLDHDFAKLFADYYHGTFFADDVELEKKGIHRLGNIFVPKENYGITIEKNLKPILEEIVKEKKDLGTYEIVWEIGKRLDNHPRKEESIIYWCYKNKIPMVIPGPFDGAFGTQFWLMYREKGLRISCEKDEDLLCNLLWRNIKTGALIIGGGISKHHTIWWNQFKGGLDYAVYITTAVEWDGSLSGAQTREAISWGKISEKARHITLYSDATLILPFLFKALIEEGL